VACTAVNVASDTSATCTTPAGSAGTASVVVTTSGGSNAANTLFTYTTTPGAPTIGTATPGDQQASVTFTAPSFTGGSAITGYRVTSNPGGITGTGASSPISVTGLTNGTAYTFSVTATNTIGTGSPSGSSNSVTPAPPPTVNLNSASQVISATSGITIIITGTGFDATAANNTVAFNLGAVGTVTAATSNQLTVTFTTLPFPNIGSLTAIVTTNGQSSGSAVQVATLVAAPSVTSSTSNLALNAATLIIAGAGFDTTAASTR
jgi:hypothetical protein